ncbi:Leader peptidase PppA [Polystyrenella longa]|uniref:Leader peptidase PppA n=1 Tax=Polystyrenella longa TaxID=2528007 RepID=A0A518CHJ6_9PLAN|nr:prepilin peptidase [Polystyrenella longa]QDU78644.1 Leader peptidase PppA [Polystyrenella longa]
MYLPPRPHQLRFLSEGAHSLERRFKPWNSAGRTACWTFVLIVLSGFTLPVSAQESNAEPASNSQTASDDATTSTRKPVLAPRPAPTEETTASETRPERPIDRSQKISPHRHNHGQPNELSWVMRLMLTAMPVLFFMWVGASIGSFLNVVIYRMPAGLNLSKPKSRCPNCLTPIRMRHNVPMFGWLMLRGKCYDCKTPISARYPLIEATVAGLFVLLFLWEFASGGANIPGAPQVQANGLIRLMSSRQAGGLAGWCAWHTLLLTLLLAMGMMHLDRQLIPSRFLGFAISSAGLLSLCFPWLYPVPLGINLPGLAGVTPSPTSAAFQISAVGPLTGVIGAFTGAMLLGSLSFVTTLSVSPRTGFAGGLHTLFWMGFLSGYYLGWQAACLISGLFVIASLALLLVNRSRYDRGMGLLVLLATLVQILWWRELNGLWNSEEMLSEKVNELLVPVLSLVVSSGLVALCVPGESQPEEEPSEGNLAENSLSSPEIIAESPVSESPKEP